MENEHEIQVAVTGTDVTLKGLPEVRKAHKKNEITIKVATDLSRQWLLNGIHSSKTQRFFGNLLVYLFYIYFIFLIAYPLMIHQYWYLLLVIPFVFFFVTMNPIARRTTGCFNVFIYLGFAVLIYAFFSEHKIFYILLSSTVLVSWLLHEVLTEMSVSQAIKALLNHEDIFLAFQSANAVFIEPGPKFGTKNPDICLHCGQEVSESAVYCKSCGERVGR